MRDVVMGVDAGGTTIRVMLADAETGQSLHEEQFPATADGGPEPLAAFLARFPQRLSHGPVSAVCAGITKISRAGVESRWQLALQNAFPHLPEERWRVAPDFVIAHHGAIPGGLGLTVIAGTGSVVYGEDAEGQAVRVGGRGWEYGDEGSGAYVTTDALRRTIRALDGLEPLSPLGEMIVSFLGTREAGTFAERARQCAAEDGRGFLVPLIRDAALAGDGEARNLFVGAAGWLATFVRAAYRQRNFDPDAPLRVATVGGLWEVGDGLTVPFASVLARWLPNVTVLPPDAQPVQGAVRLARRSLLSPV